MSRHELQLLTVGTNTFIDDTRYSVDFQHPNNFRLSIRNVSKENDEGVYLCQVFSCQIANCIRELPFFWTIFQQISTHPPKVMQFYLHVNGEFQYCESCVGIFILIWTLIKLNWLWQLSCRIRFNFSTAVCDWLSESFFNMWHVGVNWKARVELIFLRTFLVGTNSLNCEKIKEVG